MKEVSMPVVVIIRWLMCAFILFTPLVISGCAEEVPVGAEDEIPDRADDENPEDPELSPDDTLFVRYVAMGDAMTAGYMSGGINQDTQQKSYAVLLAEAMGTDFNVPLIENPGCPPPITDAYTGARADTTACSGLVGSALDLFHNVAVPGAHMEDFYGDFDEPSAMNEFLLGGRPQLEALVQAEPTFVSIWIGTERLWNEMRSGNPETDWLYDFEDRYLQLLDSLNALGVKGGVVIGLFGPVSPYWSSGERYATAKIEGILPDSFDVAPNCSGEGAYSLVPFDYAMQELLSRAQSGEAVQLDCLNDDEVLRWEEWGDIQNSVEAANGVLESWVELEAGWAFVFPRDLGLSSTRFPNLPGSGEAVFGRDISLDGEHPSEEGHRVIANTLIQAINSHYGTNLPNLDASTD